MAFLGGWLSPGLTAATNTVGAYQGAQATLKETAKKDAITAALQLRQQHNDEIANALKAAQTKALATVKPKRIPEKFSAGGKDVQGSMDESGAYFDAAGNPVTDAAPFATEHEGSPLPTTSGYVQRDGTPILGKNGRPLMPPATQGTNVYLPSVGPDGKTVYSVGSSKGAPNITATDTQKPMTGAGGGAMGQGVQARLLGAVAEARAASKRMDAYENKMLADPVHATPGLLTQLGGKLATRMSGQHSMLGIAGETAGEAMTDPEYLQYVRDAGLMARATQLMSSRGGSEAMVSAEQLLNRAVPNAAGLQGSVAAARKSRNAIFGPVGGLMQALTPEQIAKVNAGLDALEKGDATSPAIREAGTILDAAKAPGASSGAPSQAQALWDAAVAKHGQAKVLAEYGPRPQE